MTSKKNYSCVACLCIGYVFLRHSFHVDQVFIRILYKSIVCLIDDICSMGASHFCCCPLVTFVPMFGVDEVGFGFFQILSFSTISSQSLQLSKNNPMLKTTVYMESFFLFGYREYSIGGIILNGADTRYEILKWQDQVTRLVDIVIVLFEVVLVDLNIVVNEMLHYVSDLR